MLYKAKKLFENMKNDGFNPDLFFLDSVVVEAIEEVKHPALLEENAPDKQKWGGCKLSFKDYGLSAIAVAEQSKKMDIFIKKYERKLGMKRELFDVMTREKIKEEFYKQEGLM